MNLLRIGATRPKAFAAESSALSGTEKRHAVAICGHHRGLWLHGRSARGFTLVELIIVVLLMSILSFVAMGRLNDRRDVDAHGFAEQLASSLRFAQKAAVAQRRTLYIGIDASAGRLRVCLDPLPACTQPLASPSGGLLDIHAPDAVVFTTSATSLSIDAQGRPSIASVLRLHVTAATGATFDVTVEPDSGYVRRT